MAEVRHIWYTCETLGCNQDIRWHESESELAPKGPIRRKDENEPIKIQQQPVYVCDLCHKPLQRHEETIAPSAQAAVASTQGDED